MVLLCCKVLSQHFPGGTRKTIGNISQNMAKNQIGDLLSMNQE